MFRKLLLTHNFWERLRQKRREYSDGFWLALRVELTSAHLQ